jgi:hypothetical protein
MEWHQIPITSDEQYYWTPSCLPPNQRQIALVPLPSDTARPLGRLLRELHRYVMHREIT